MVTSNEDLDLLTRAYISLRKRYTLLNDDDRDLIHKLCSAIAKARGETEQAINAKFTKQLNENATLAERAML